jgi:hypothetical protein
MVIINLTARAFQIAVMVKALQAPQNLLSAAWQKGSEMIRTKKPVTVDVVENFAVTFRQPHWANGG